ncbi:hypothetical protein [Actinotalea sp. K2]|uniref:hypothetical protein n=1 Tax=Actinotalea sp. K2 TaxID=2939438 RepID=UPI002017841C|nr:hypothetical protein [Actinotalea sp. K2]MCL3859513.1 hypothetical protein [Actinotalea sp. K2]
MTGQAGEPAPWGLDLLTGLRRSVRERTLSRGRALGLMVVLVLGWLGLAGLFVLGCFVVALLAVLVTARHAPGQGVRADDPDVLAIAIVLGVTAVAAGVAVSRRNRRRRARTRQWAGAHGWDYQRRSSLLSSRWSARGIPFSAHATDVLRRADARGEVASSTIGSGLADWSSRHAVMVVGPRRFPSLTVTPMTFLDRVARAVGGQDLTVESYDVNERWRIRCADARFAHDVLSPRLLERLARADLPGLRLLVEERDVVVHAPGPTDLARVELMADLVLDLAALLPTYLPDDYPPFGPDVPRRDRRPAPRRMR